LILQRAAACFVEWLEKEAASSWERIPDGTGSWHQPEKTMYRACSVLLSEIPKFREEVLSNRLLSRDEALWVLRNAHEWFRKFLSTQEGLDVFDLNYKFHYEAVTM